MNKFITSLLAGCALAVSVSLLASESEATIHKSFRVNEGGKLRMEVFGSIEVVTGDNSTVDVVIERKVNPKFLSDTAKILEKHEVTFTQNGDDIHVRAEFKPDRKWFSGQWRLQAKQIVTIPKRFHLDLKTAGGSIRLPDQIGDVRFETAGGSLHSGSVEGSLYGRTAGGSIETKGSTGKVDVETAGGSIRVDSGQDIRASTSGGSIRIGRASGGVTATTAGGSIHVDDVSGSVTAKTSGGSIRIGKAEGKLHAETAGGGIHIDQAGGTITALTSAGSVQARFTKDLEENSRIETSGGSVTITVPSSFNAELDAEASGGRVSTDLPVTVSGNQEHGRLKGKVGNGGKTLKVRTSAGNIQLRKLEAESPTAK
jgi:hypothetical protein